MTSHLSQDDLILAYYGELDSRGHVDACEVCRQELARLAHVLDQVTPEDVPEPAEDYESRVWDRLAWRLRQERRHRSSAATGFRWAAAAAVVVLAFAAGSLLKNRPALVTQPSTALVEPVRSAPTEQQQRDRILLVVVNDHFDRSERMLVELTNLTPTSENDFTSEREKAEELLADNRLYRRTALDRGEEGVATLLDELEPVLIQLAHAPSTVSADEIRSMQKRVEAKGLVFKIRVVRADTRATTPPGAIPTNI